MMLSNYNSISSSNNSSSDSMNLKKVDENESNKKYLFIGLISGMSGMIIGIIMCIIIGPFLQANNSNNNGLNLVPSHNNLEELGAVHDQLQHVQQPSNLDFGNDANMVANMVANMANGEKYANSHDFSSKLDISSDAIAKITWIAKARLTDLSDGNIVTIRSAVYGSYLQNPSSTNKVKTELQYSTNRHLWIVSKVDSKNAYTFKNFEDNCYLKSSDGYLKCMEGESGNIYWVSGGITSFSGDSSDYKKLYSELKNYSNNKCPKVGSATDDKISMSTSVCDFTASAFRFEIMN